MLSLAEPASATYIIKQSRFVVHCGPVASQEATLAFYQSVADPTANHNCWAWKLQDSYRFNDDGEPGGTAGKPILTAIEGKGLSQVMVIVTRYFGGIKLGTGGLVRAYSGCTARCLDQAKMIELHSMCQCRIAAAFEYTGELHAAVAACEAEKLQESFAANGLEMLVEVRLDRLRQLQSLLRDNTRGSATIQQL